jgi:hypothetical protein
MTKVVYYDGISDTPLLIGAIPTLNGLQVEWVEIDSEMLARINADPSQMVQKKTPAS